jgi:hypothetical protein
MRRVLQTLAALVAGLTALSATPLAAQSDHSQHHPPSESTSIVRTPPSLAAEHRELHETLSRAVAVGGELGSAADELERALAPHFRREDEIATPPLGLLTSLATGPATAEMRAVLPMTEALERELPQMLREHEAIREAVGKFRATAVRAKLLEFVQFSDQLAAHARSEEEILYPAAILVGRYVARSAPDR